MNKKPVSCPVCGKDNFKVLYEPWSDVTDPKIIYGAASGVRGTQQIVRCRACGMIYENPRYPKEVILEGYESSNDAGHDSQYPMRVRSFLNALRRVGKHIPPGNSSVKVLDIGTAGGAFLEAAQQYGYDTYGLEPSQFLVNSGKKRGFKIEQGTVDKNPFKPGTFDMVCLWDVIEHLVDPKSDLEKIRALLKPDGILLINYPDIGTLPAKLAGSKFWWILSVHLHHFDRKSLTEICRLSGFETFFFKMYWQILEFGYLEQIAAHLKVPGAASIEKCTPGFIKRIPLPYYASQTTCLARLK